jgi:hypothetical protein
VPAAAPCHTNPCLTTTLIAPLDVDDLRLLAPSTPDDAGAVPLLDPDPGLDPYPCPDLDLDLDLADCRAWGTRYLALAQQAVTKGVEARSLAVRGLLQLPRVAGRDGLVSERTVRGELLVAAGRLRVDADSVEALCPVDKVPLRELRFELLQDGIPERILSALHYLRGPRPGSLNFALVDPVKRRPVTLCSVSPLDWDRVGNRIQTDFGIPRSGMWDVCRVYSFEVAPTNAISFLLARVRKWLRQNEAGAELLVTAVDPNLGFTGASYRAANWQQWMTVRARPYLYHQGQYVSPRGLRSVFGTTNLADLQAREPGPFETSRARLVDSMIFCCRVNGPTQIVPEGSRPRVNR